MPNRRVADSAESSVGKALQVLKMLRDSGEVRVTRVAEALGVAPSTAHRLLAELRAHEFVTQLETSRGYVPGPELLRLATEMAREDPLDEVARPHLEALSERVNETVNLQVLAGSQVLFLVSIEVDLPLRVVRRAGSRSPAYSSAAGKTLLAALPPSQVDVLYGEGADLPARTAATIPDVPALHDELERVRARGFATNIGEEADGVNAVAVPVTDAAGRTRAAISIAAPDNRLPADSLEPLVPALKETAERVASDLLRSRRTADSAASSTRQTGNGRSS